LREALESPGCSGSAGERSLNQRTILVDEAGQEPEMDDRAVACGHEIDHLAHGCGFLVTGHDKDTRGDLARVASLIKEGPDEAGLILIIKIGSDIHLVHQSSSPSGRASRVRGIGLRSAEGFEQVHELLIVRAVKAHGEVRALRGGQQLESVLSQPACVGR
jgi:hypothetical protein